MKTSHSSRCESSGLTLIEMSLVLFLLITLMATGMFFNNKITEWKAGRDASEILRTVYSAQRMYLADNPTAVVSNITTTMIIPYLPNGATVMPTVKSLTGTTLAIRVNVSPPNINNGSNGNYDPSPSTTDMLWDVGP